MHQVFVANPKKPPQIENILRRNREKLLHFLKTFHNDKEGTLFLYVQTNHLHNSHGLTCGVWLLQMNNSR